MLLLAAGRSERFGGKVPKVYLDCAGKPVLLRSVERLAQVTPDREIVLVANPLDREHLEPWLARLQAAGVTRVVDGGATRQESMTRALAATDARHPMVLVHDAARPLFPIQAARDAIARAAQVGGALLAVPVTDTLKRVSADGLVEATLGRARLFCAQTPQVARREILQRALAHAKVTGFEATDDVALLEHAGFPVAVVPGSARNVKITAAEDLALAAALARVAEDA